MPVARRLDQGLLSLLELVAGLPVPQGRSEHGITLETPIPGREGWSFAAWVMRQPVKCGGLSLRSYAEMCRPAFLGAVEIAIPKLHTGFCPLLEEVVGGEERFRDEWEGRWQTLHSSGSRLGREHQTSWVMLQAATRRTMEYLGEV